MGQSELRTLKSPRAMISERGDCKVMGSIDLERWSKGSSWSSELGEQSSIQMYLAA